ncbi:hypothetical protein EXU85_20625 [Spirosoma sp. KCTC 42546]|uniref:hypothetical protein n=1 Tax=Spirosoma sp. KCTC 42546 TaxID=2520506 RepID=UPI00115B1EBF|nr:hypothetical protein [Spirosoma sp. KCTC 42546]QDK80886.1 hypothetical protein EXU85_20625 [Spirosoma sp. KCTC 42546]
MERKTLLKQKLNLEYLLTANLKEVQFLQASEDVDWATLDRCYLSGRALAAAHMEVVNELARMK